jgi:ABC-type Fe3+-siderophore transport system permease subunit
MSNMKSSKRRLFYLLLTVMVLGAIINIVYAVNEELYKTLNFYQTWFLVIVAVLFIVNEIKNRNKSEANFENQEESSFAKSITLVRKKLIAFTGLGISLIGCLLFATLDSPLLGSIISSSGLLIIYYATYLFSKK